MKVPLISSSSCVSPWMQRVSAVLYSLSSCAGALFILRGGGCGGGVGESSLCVVGAASLARVDGRWPLIERRVLPFMGNVADAGLFRGASLHTVQSPAVLKHRIWVRMLDLEAERKNKCVLLMRLKHLQSFTAEWHHLSHPTFDRHRRLRNVECLWRRHCSGHSRLFGSDCKTDTWTAEVNKLRVGLISDDNKDFYFRLSVVQVWLKGIVHPKIKIQSLSTHPHADGKLGEALEFTKHCRSFTGRRCCSDIHIIEAYGGQDSNVQKFIMKPMSR